MVGPKDSSLLPGWSLDTPNRRGQLQRASGPGDAILQRMAYLIDTARESVDSAEHTTSRRPTAVRRVTFLGPSSRTAPGEPVPPKPGTASASPDRQVPAGFDSPTRRPRLERSVEPWSKVAVGLTRN